MNNSNLSTVWSSHPSLSFAEHQEQELPLLLPVPRTSNAPPALCMFAPAMRW